MRFLAGVAVTICILIIFGIIIIYSGWVNVSAANKPSDLESWLLGTTMDNSVEKHAENLNIPDLKSSDKINEGFIHYDEMCAGCHGAPGKSETDLAKGLNPDAPDLSKSATELTPKEIFWVTKNGIKMTGMPSWGKSHSDDKIWALVAFIEKLPGMSGAQYDSLKAHLIPMKME